MRTYFRFRDRTGPQCPYCLGVLKNLYVREVERLRGDFLKMIETGDWSNYE